MVAQKSGRVVHIDFGDCFEITKTRSKYPEIIPFRLTRMLTNGMGGPASLLGSYKMDCERVRATKMSALKYYSFDLPCFVTFNYTFWCLLLLLFYLLALLCL